MKSKLHIAVTLLAAAIVATEGKAANLSATERLTKELPLNIDGSFAIDNPFGNVEIVGSDQPGLSITIVKMTSGVDKAAVQDAREQTQIVLGGDERMRVIRTVLPAVRPSRWSSNVSYTIRVPRSVHVKVSSNSAERIHIANISGNVTVKNFAGVIALDGIIGATVIDTINGSIIWDTGVNRPSANTQMTTVNGNIEVRLPADSNFEWVAQTIKGDFYTSLPTRIFQFDGTQLRAGVNSPGGPTITTATMMGSVRVLRRGGAVGELQSVRQALAAPDRRNVIVQASASSPVGPLVPAANTVQLPLVPGNWIFSTSIGDVLVGEIRGSARVSTGAGRVELGSVYGECNVTSRGGPLSLGDVFGLLTARTDAGDILVRAAREGGTVTTTGGNIRVIYTGAAMELTSGGGDVIVRQTLGPIVAETRSGDITITADPAAKTLKIDARTAQGNVVLNVSPRFGADVDAIIMTSDPDANSIRSDFHGLAVKKEQVGRKTRIHATGKINGGGDRVALYAEEGDISILQQTGNPITLIQPGQ